MLLYTVQKPAEPGRGFISAQFITQPLGSVCEWEYTCIYVSVVLPERVRSGLQG